MKVIRMRKMIRTGIKTIERFWRPLKRGQKVAGILVGILIVLLVYIFWLLMDPRLKLTIPLAQETIENLQPVCLQRGSLVYLNDLNHYFFLTNHFDRFETWLNEKKAQGEITATGRGGELFLNQEICLAPLIKNHCEERYCFQHKIPFSDVPPILWKGLIGVEDYRFLKHVGIDWTSILRALLADLRAMRAVQGGSTLTQQLVKNLLLTNEKSVLRKFKEMIYSFSLEASYEKEDILGAYFNEVYWGGGSGLFIRGIYGASLFYFGKRPQDLADFETLILVAMLKGPQYYNPYLHLSRLQERTSFVIQKLLERGLIAPDIKETAWTEEQWQRWRHWFEQKRRGQNLQSIWYVSKTVENFNQTAINPFEQLVWVESLYRLQSMLKEKIHARDLAFKLLVANPFTPSSEHPPFSFYSKWERNNEKAMVEEKHQIGSLLKPLLYSIYQELGATFSDTIQTAPLTLKMPAGNWVPREAHTSSQTMLTLREALQKSLNNPPIRMAQQLGFSQVESKLVSYIPELKKPLKHYPSQMLGALEMDLHAVFDLYQRVIKEQCVLYQRGEETILQVLSYPELTTISSVIDEKLRGIRFFGKTGTSNQGLDNWYVAYDGKLLYVLWFGVESGRKIGSISLYGSTSAFRIFQDFFIHRGRNYPEFGCPQKN